MCSENMDQVRMGKDTAFDMNTNTGMARDTLNTLDSLMSFMADSTG